MLTSLMTPIMPDRRPGITFLAIDCQIRPRVAVLDSNDEENGMSEPTAARRLYVQLSDNFRSRVCKNETRLVVVSFDPLDKETTMKIHAKSHLDHHLTDAQVVHIEQRFADRTEPFFIETFELPPELGVVPCGLFGPVMGDLPVSDAEATRAKRGERAWQSRLVDRPARHTRVVTVIAGAHDEVTTDGSKVHHPCILYTAFGGPQAPQEPGDIRRQLEAAELERRERDAKDGDPTAALPREIWDGQDHETVRAKHDPLYAKIVALRGKRAVSDAFWRDHALAK